MKFPSLHYGWTSLLAAALAFLVAPSSAYGQAATQAEILQAYWEVYNRIRTPGFQFPGQIPGENHGMFGVGLSRSSTGQIIYSFGTTFPGGAPLHPAAIAARRELVDRHISRYLAAGYVREGNRLLSPVQGEPALNINPINQCVENSIHGPLGTLAVRPNGVPAAFCVTCQAIHGPRVPDLSQRLFIVGRRPELLDCNMETALFELNESIRTGTRRGAMRWTPQFHDYPTFGPAGASQPLAHSAPRLSPFAVPPRMAPAAPVANCAPASLGLVPLFCDEMGISLYFPRTVNMLDFLSGGALSILGTGADHGYMERVAASDAESERRSRERALLQSQQPINPAPYLRRRNPDPQSTQALQLIHGYGSGLHTPASITSRPFTPGVNIDPRPLSDALLRRIYTIPQQRELEMFP